MPKAITCPSSDERGDNSSVSTESRQFSATRNRFFIIGCPRSGTTLLQVILNRHPKILIPPETKLFFYYHRMPSWIRKITIDRINRDLGIELRSDFARRSMTTDKTFDRMMELYSRRTSKHSVAWFGEKSPEHTTRTQWIRDTFPDAKFLAISRDGRDVAASLMNAPWINCSHLGAALIWRRYQNALSEFLKSNEKNTLLIKYEDLVQEPRVAVCRMLSHLELDPNEQVDRMLDRHPFDSRSFPLREMKWKSTSLLPISKDVCTRSSQRLSERQISEIECVVREQLDRFGYSVDRETESRKVSLIRRSAHLCRLLMDLPPRCLFSESIATFSQCSRRIWHGEKPMSEEYALK